MKSQGLKYKNDENYTIKQQHTSGFTQSLCMRSVLVVIDSTPCCSSTRALNISLVGSDTVTNTHTNNRIHWGEDINIHIFIFFVCYLPSVRVTTAPLPLPKPAPGNLYFATNEVSLAMINTKTIWLHA